MTFIHRMFIFTLVGCAVTFFSSCEEEILPPIADFTVEDGFLFLPLVSDIRADITSVGFINTSTGEITDYAWEFEDGLGNSDLENPSYVFDFEGERNVKLTVSGPGGSNSVTKQVRAFAFPPCENFWLPSAYSKESIDYYRNSGLVQNLPEIRVYNPYANDFHIKTYDPTSWLNGIYDNIRGSRTITSGQTEVILSNLMTNEWGIQASTNNGAISCVRIIGRMGYSAGGIFYINVEDILDGEFQ